MLYDLCSEIDEFGFSCFRRVKELLLQKKGKSAKDLQEACSSLSSNIEVIMKDLKQVILSAIDETHPDTSREQMKTELRWFRGLVHGFDCFAYPSS